MERNTRQREAIRQAFLHAARPLGTHEVLVAAKRDVPGLGIATVYRNLKALVDDGWLEPVELPGEPPRYETTGKGHHHHFHCETCDRLFDLAGCVGSFQALVSNGFELERHELMLYGRCADCANEG